MSIAPNTQQTIRPNWASVPVRLDPADSARRQTVEMIEDGEAVTYWVDRRGAVIRRRLSQSGLPISIALPARAFRGVAARAMEDGAGQVTVTLELYHEDPNCTVPLLVACDLYDVAADWRGWAELFDLPMLMIEADGSICTLEESFGSVKAAAPAPRRRSANRQRRPRFLARRKPGLGIRMIVSGEEIIARH
ncbi:DUF6101 family protein [Aurantimonas sp. VKM B-3413]|uniref:DUF6101 family protein n=1 Tax=Aurantimonas sp. VKM B-3413 TaxID=2779401 RepID=UPI001E34AFDC|nr:DUF6101 family protein [Aurantimonas sp. VKM B-3413]MCB8840017.1 DUF6101 family protein [Aurantimonas sp. VKM B-3413]